MKITGSDDSPKSHAEEVAPFTQQDTRFPLVPQWQEDEGVKEAQRKALAAVEEYHNEVTTKLLEQALEGSSDGACKAVQELITAHRREMDRAFSENMQLRSWLKQSTSAVDKLTQQLSEATQDSFTLRVVGEFSNDAPKVPQADAVAFLTQHTERETSLQENPVQPSGDAIEDEASAPTLTKAEQQNSGDANPAMASVSDLMEETPSQGKLTEHAGGDGRQMRLNSQSVADLMARHAKDQAVIRNLRDECMQWKTSAAEHQDMLKKAMQEAACYREELVMLKVTTVPLAQYKTAIQVRDAATYELEAAKLNAARFAEELEMERNLRNTGRVCPDEITASTLSKQVQDVMAHLAGDDVVHSANEEGGPYMKHEVMWDIALRELDEQGVQAATHRDVQDRLKETERHLEQITQVYHTLESTTADLRMENEALRLDAQALVYRNGVLSQQLISLLVKVEHLRRELVRAGGSVGAVDLYGSGSKPDTKVHENRNVWQKDAARAAAIASEVLRRRSADEERPTGSLSLLSGTSLSLSSSAAAPAPRPSVDVEGAATLQKACASFTQLSHFPYLPGTARSRGLPAAADETLSLERKSHPAMVPIAPLRVPLSLDASLLASIEGDTAQGSCSLPDTLCIERGLQRTLSTFSLSFPPKVKAHRHRTLQHVTLRNFGGTIAGVPKPSAMRLPTCDHLTGMALGHPPSHILLDSHKGSFTREGATAEALFTPLTHVVQDPSTVPQGQIPKPSLNEEKKTNLTFSTATVSTKGLSGIADHSDHLSMLAMLDPDEQLDRYAVNTVSELVVRNQELLQELYVVTQRADAAEARLRSSLLHTESHHMKKEAVGGDVIAPQFSKVNPLEETADGFHAVASTSSDESLKSIAQGTGEYVSSFARKRARHSTEAVTIHVPDSQTDISSEDSTSACRSFSSLSSRLSVPIGSTPVSPGCKVNLARAGAVPVSPTRGQDAQAGLPAPPPHAAPPASRGEAETTRDPGPGFRGAEPDNCCHPPNACRAITTLAEAALEHHHASMAHLDKGLAASLLRVLHAQSAAAAVAAALGGAEGGAGGGSGSIVDQALIQPLAEVCTSQAVTLAQQTIELANARRETQLSIHRSCWETSQQLLQNAVRELKDFLREIVSDHQESPALGSPSSTSAQRKRPRSGDPGTTVASSMWPSLANFDDVALLERIEQLLQLASDKEDTMLRVYRTLHSRQLHFISLKERKMHRMAAKLEKEAQLLQRSTAPVVRGSPIGSSPVKLAASCFDLHPKTLVAAAAAAAGGGEFAHEMGRNVDEQAHDTSAQEEEGVNLHVSSNIERAVECGSIDNYNDDESDLDTTSYTKLREQLTVEQAKMLQLTEELNAERDRHVELSARMWQLEVEREDAVAAQVRLEARMASMWTREQFEGMIAELDAAKAAIEDRDAQLAYAHQDRKRLSAELEHHIGRYNVFIEETQDATKQRELQLDCERLRNAQLTQECAQHELHIANLVEEAKEHAQNIADREEHIAELEQQLSKLKDALLSEDRTQAILERLYPGDTVVAAHTQLVHAMREEREALESRVQGLLLQVRDSNAALVRKDTELRQAEQRRQSAENLLQETLHSITQQEPMYRQPAEGEEDIESQLNKQREDSASAWSDLISCTWSTASKKQILELQACIETQERTIQRLQQSEAAWVRREEALREQLATMSLDPISEVVRRHGLTATRNFETTIKELEARMAELQAQVDVHATKEAELEATLRQVEDVRLAAVLRAEEFQKHIDDITVKYDTSRRECQELRVFMVGQTTRLDAQDATLQQLRGELADLQDSKQSTEQALEQCMMERNKFFLDNKTLLDKVNELVQELMKADNEKRAALAQGVRAAGATGEGITHHHHSRIGAGHGSGLRARVSLTADLSDAMRRTAPSSAPPLLFSPRGE